MCPKHNSKQHEIMLYDIRISIAHNMMSCLNKTVYFLFLRSWSKTESKNLVDTTHRNIFLFHYIIFHLKENKRMRQYIHWMIDVLSREIRTKENEKFLFCCYFFCVTQFSSFSSKLMMKKLKTTKVFHHTEAIPDMHPPPMVLRQYDKGHQPYDVEL